MRHLALSRRSVSAFGCGLVFLFGLPRAVHAPLPPDLFHSGVCERDFGPRTPAKPEPLQCWEALASWYGKSFDGQETAGGGTFDMRDQTVAHPTLPLGSIVRISNPRTGRSLVATVNDRGPYVPGRSLDVSYQVARVLGFAHRGIARVQIELLKLPTTSWLPSRAKN